MAAERAESTSDSSSQSGIADNETEAELNHLPDRAQSAPQAPAPPKKKRTRTLTTPHQSAVLHALLAKSRFPTTAMREEVGRQIGLSARKVQIWFQNQRQKARRPQADSAPLSRPPQFGPFPIMNPAGPSSSAYPSPSAGGSGSNSAQSDAPPSLDSIPVLSRSGVPWPSSSYQRSPQAHDPPRRPRTSPEMPLGNPPSSLATRDSRAAARGLAPHPTSSTPIESSPHFSGVLPPITLSPLEPHSGESYVSATSPFPPQLSSRPFVPHPPVEHGSSVRPGIPPPFVLQPQPQWDPLTFMPYTRPEFASWLHPSGSSTRTSFSTHDRVTHSLSPDTPRRRHHLSFSEPYPPFHHIPPSSRHLPISTSAASRASSSRESHARSDDEEA